MNKVILMGRLVRDPEIRYTQGMEPVAVTKYTLAVNRRLKRQGESEADFIGCVAFGKAAEFAEKFLKKGQMISVIGRIQVRAWDDSEGKKRRSTEVVVEEQYFAESKSAFEARCAQSGENMSKTTQPPVEDGFYPIDESMESDDLPF